MKNILSKTIWMFPENQKIHGLRILWFEYPCIIFVIIKRLKCIFGPPILI